jgi:excisionase family DNA binding protein
VPPTDLSARGHTPQELARLLRVSPDKVRTWIRTGELPAVDVAAVRCGRPRYVVLPEQLATFLTGRTPGPPVPRARRQRRRPGLKDYYHD